LLLREARENAEKMTEENIKLKRETDETTSQLWRRIDQLNKQLIAATSKEKVLPTGPKKLRNTISFFQNASAPSPDKFPSPQPQRTPSKDNGAEKVRSPFDGANGLAQLVASTPDQSADQSGDQLGDQLADQLTDQLADQSDEQPEDPPGSLAAVQLTDGSTDVDSKTHDSFSNLSAHVQSGEEAS
jgi:hypothetical protein